MRGRNSVVIGIRVSEGVNTILKEMAAKKGITVSAFVKGKIEEYARLANETTITNKPKDIRQKGYIEDKGDYVIIGGVKYRKQGGNDEQTGRDKGIEAEINLTN